MDGLLVGCVLCDTLRACLALPLSAGAWRRSGVLHCAAGPDTGDTEDHPDVPVHRPGGGAGAADDPHHSHEGGVWQQVAGGSEAGPGCWQDDGNAAGTGEAVHALVRHFITHHHPNELSTLKEPMRGSQGSKSAGCSIFSPAAALMVMRK